MIKDKEKLLKKSWFRCYEKGVDKTIKQPLNYVNAEQLEEKKDKNQNLINLFNKHTKELLNKYSFQDMFFFLIDREGILIESYYPSNQKEKFGTGG